MPCSMAYKYDWCSKDKELIKASDGNRYCIFHAPHGEKNRMDTTEFNRLVFDRISKCIESGAGIDLSGTVFEGDFSFVSQGPALGSNHNEVNFSGVTFIGKADFSSVHFTSEINFKKAAFCKAADFSNATFDLAAHFDNARFNSESDFTYAHFYEQAHFFDADFLAKADFTDALFDKEVYFTLGAFKSGANFNSVKYGARAVFKRPYTGIGASTSPESIK